MMFYYTASHFILHDKLHDALLQYGIDFVALKLLNRSILSSTQYSNITNLALNNHLKSLVLIAYVMKTITIRSKYEDFKEFLSSDNILWHLPIIRQIIGE